LDRTQPFAQLIGHDDIRHRHAPWCQCGDEATAQQLEQNIMLASRTNSRGLACHLYGAPFKSCSPTKAIEMTEPGAV
jgi:hypothetical protein